MSFYSQIKIVLENSESFSFFYCYSQNTTFEDLLEFILYNFPNKNLCPCYTFINPYNKDRSSISYIKNNSKVIDFIKNNNSCTSYHIIKKSKDKQCCDSLIQNHYKKSKTQMIQYISDVVKEFQSKLDGSANLISGYEKQIKDLKSDFENKKNLVKEEIKKEYENKIKKLEQDNNLLKLSINGNIEIINQLKNFGLINEDFKMKDNNIKIDPKSNQIVVNNENINGKSLVEFYDVIIDIKSIKDIINGWEIKMSKRAEEKYNSFKNEKMIKVGIIGNANKGKSFLLSKLSKIELPSGSSIRTEGLSIKYPELDIFKDRKIALLDSAGLEAPVLKDEKLKILEKQEKKEEEENYKKIMKM